MKYLLDYFPFTFLSRLTNPYAYAMFADGDGDGDGPQGGSPEGVLPDGVMKSFDKLLDKFDSERQAAMELFHENKKYRDKNRELQNKVEKMEEVGDDQVVVDEEEYNSYREVVDMVAEEDEDVEEAKKRIENLRNDSKELAKERDRRKKETAASEYGWNPQAFRDLFDDHDLEKRSRETDDGEEETYYVVVEENEDGKQKEVEVSDYVEDNYSHMKPALEQDGESDQQKNYPPQQPHRGDDESSGDLVDSFIDQQNENASKPNKLDKATGRANGSQES